MPSIAQEHRRIAISTPLGKDALLLRGFSGSEAISQLFHFDLDLVSENDSVKFQDVVGKNVTLRIYDAAGAERYWNGFISRFSQGSQDRRLTGYRAQMVPWLWFLTRTADCRIFQNLKVPDIIQKIFKDLGFSDFELRLYGNYTPRDYCVQYRETDFNFVSRLMEEEGICYFFDHQESKHVLVLADDPAAHKAHPNQKTARYDFRGGSATYEDVVNEFLYQEEFRTGKWAQTDYNFETPSTSLAVTVSGQNPYEIYEFPGQYMVRPAGERLAKIRLQEQTVPAVVFQGTSGCRYFTPGCQFTLQDHYRSDLNQAYLLTAVRHSATQGGNFEVGSAGGEELSYRNTFECIPATIPYRPARVTPEPFVQGCQTAVVVGPAGEEIYTDKYGRVKVQFFWDREGKKNENSSCWVRVSHPWAGQGWGAVSIPRIGQEVIVDFMEGDPDQPIITGRVYNAEQMPPFALPGKAVISGVKSNSTKGGGGNNEISLDDTKGNELINIHAQYDQQKKVEHDERVNIGHDRTEEVGHDETITIDNIQNLTVKVNRIIDVGKDHTEAIHGSMSLSVDRTKSETVLINSAETIGAAKELSVGGLYQVTVGGAHNTTVGGAKTEQIGAFRGETVGGKKTVAIGGDHSVAIGGKEGLTVAKDRSVTIAGKFDETVQKAFTLKAKTITLQAEDEIVISVGKAKIAMKKDGTVVVEGNDLSLKASGKINQKASGDIIIKGSKIAEN